MKALIFASAFDKQLFLKHEWRERFFEVKTEKKSENNHCELR
jgi:hypothetical protein